MYISPCMHACCLPAYLPACLLLEYVRLAQARPTMSLVIITCLYCYMIVISHAMLICACGVEPGHCISGVQHNYDVVQVELDVNCITHA